MVTKPYIIVRAQDVPEYKQRYIVPNKKYICFDYYYYSDSIQGIGNIKDEDGATLVILLNKPCAHLNQGMWEVVD